KPQEMVVLCGKQVEFLPDPTSNGQLRPVLAPRIFFLQDNGFATVVDGTLTIDVFDDSPQGNGNPPKQIHRNTTSSDILQKMRRQDEIMGIGYVAVFPWTSYKPDIRQIHMNIRFEPANGGEPITAITETITLDPPSAKIQQSSRYVP